MIFKVFSVFDSKVGAYLPPFFLRSTSEAVRSFSDAINDDKLNFKRHAEDYTLFEIGTWDDSSCKLVMLNTPHSLGLASEMLVANHVIAEDLLKRNPEVN